MVTTPTVRGNVEPRRRPSHGAAPSAIVSKLGLGSSHWLVCIGADLYLRSSPLVVLLPGERATVKVARWPLPRFPPLDEREAYRMYVRMFSISRLHSNRPHGPPPSTYSKPTRNRLPLPGTVPKKRTIAPRDRQVTVCYFLHHNTVQATTDACSCCGRRDPPTEGAPSSAVVVSSSSPSSLRDF